MFVKKSKAISKINKMKISSFGIGWKVQNTISSKYKFDDICCGYFTKVDSLCPTTNIF